MPTVRPASAVFNPSPVICSPEREDEPDLRELVRDALILSGFLPLCGFTTAIDGPVIRVRLAAGPLLRERILLAWAALGAFDSALLAEDCIVVGWPGELQAVAA